MTRKHFQAIAEVLRSVKPDRGNRYAPRALKTRQAGAFAHWEQSVRAFAAMCARFNPRFKPDRFFKACDFQAEE